jgi:methionyl-tRNA formyltransferase
MSSGRGIVLLCGPGPSTGAVYNALVAEFGSVRVIMEEPVSRLQMAKRRAAKLGFFQTAGQMAFAAAVVPFLSRASRRRIEEIKSEFGLRTEMSETAITRVANVNTSEARDELRSADPAVVVVNGTRIIGVETLSAVDVPFINTHAGITPLYRGVHGGYWALAEGRRDLVGTTVHYVDRGIDTGRIIAQAFFEVTDMDNFATYPYLHTAAGISILVPAVRDALAGEPATATPEMQLESKLRHHPTIWGYIWNRLRRGVR